MVKNPVKTLAELREQRNDKRVWIDPLLFELPDGWTAVKHQIGGNVDIDGHMEFAIFRRDDGAEVWVDREKSHYPGTFDVSVIPPDSTPDYAHGWGGRIDGLAHGVSRYEAYYRAFEYMSEHTLPATVDDVGVGVGYAAGG